MNQKIRTIGCVILVAVWAALVGCAWFGSAKTQSEAERRPLAQMPEVSGGSLLSGKFMTAFEDYTLDQFPWRDGFRTLKSLFHYGIFNQKDNNDIYLVDGYAAKLEYPVNMQQVNHGTNVFNRIYEQYLKDTGSVVFTSVIPDKGYYLAQQNGYPAMDYEAMFAAVQQNMPWATYVDITGCLDITDYYFTDTHWRQEKLLPVAQKLAQAMGTTVPQAEDFGMSAVERPFYGVYYGQAALPLNAETMYLIESDLLAECQVLNHENGKYMPVYDSTMLQSRDLYDMYLAGSKSLLTIENPNATTDWELIIFRDSFGSSLAPLLVQDYKTVTLVDVRYLNSTVLGQYLDFHGQDVLFLYSTLVLNSDTQRMQ